MTDQTAEQTTAEREAQIAAQASQAIEESAAWPGVCLKVREIVEEGMREFVLAPYGGKAAELCAWATLIDGAVEFAAGAEGTLTYLAEESERLDLGHITGNIRRHAQVAARKTLECQSEQERVTVLVAGVEAISRAAAMRSST